MRKAAPHACVRPDDSHCLFEACSSICDNHCRRGELDHKGRPRFRAFASRQMPCSDMLMRTCDGDDELFGDVYAVNEQDVKDFSCGMRKWPELPEPLRPSLKGCLRAALLLERSFAHKPLQKRFEAFGCAVNAMRHARAAFLTSPSCGARRCGAIPLHLPATSTASRIIQAHLLSFSNFFF